MLCVEKLILKLFIGIQTTHQNDITAMSRFRGKKEDTILKCHLHRKLVSFHIKKLIEQSCCLVSSCCLWLVLEVNRSKISECLKIANIFHSFSSSLKQGHFFMQFSSRECWASQFSHIFHINFIELLTFRLPSLLMDTHCRVLFCWFEHQTVHNECSQQHSRAFKWQMYMYGMV